MRCHSSCCTPVRPLLCPCIAPSDPDATAGVIEDEENVDEQIRQLTENLTRMKEQAIGSNNEEASFILTSMLGLLDLINKTHKTQKATTKVTLGTTMNVTLMMTNYSRLFHRQAKSECDVVRVYELHEKNSQDKNRRVLTFFQFKKVTRDNFWDRKTERIILYTELERPRTTQGN